MRSVPDGAPAALLCDMDGTLVDTEPLWSAAMAGIAHAHGAAWDEHADSSRVVGALVPEIVAMLTRRGVGLPPEAVAEILLEDVAGRLAADLPWRPGAASLLSGIAARGLPSALVTTGVRRHAVLVAQGAPAGVLPVVVASEDVADPKPDPTAYLLAASRLGVPADRCVALEDSVPGIRAALAAGIRTLAVQPATSLPAEVAGHPRLVRVDGLGGALAALGW
ncbi:HAD family hydrolase [Propionicicella superfundia]|uniref:HAD family hydrolase n=1 Tax=Propionicicella superfundia TaxID=348582 RepID=UPI000687F2E5|nr:HAD family hydrolase [Propionicicella superfundia]